MAGMIKDKKGRLRMKQILAGQFTNDDGSGSYSVVGLTEGGDVYRYDPQCQGWIAWQMQQVGKMCPGHRR